VIGIIDVGFNITHADLAGSIKYNYNDPIDGVDNDGDGYTDNFYGWDFGDNDNDPVNNTNDHGSMVAGLSSAVTNNSRGIARALVLIANFTNKSFGYIRQHG